MDECRIRNGLYNGRPVALLVTLNKAVGLLLDSKHDWLLSELPNRPQSLCRLGNYLAQASGYRVHSVSIGWLSGWVVTAQGPAAAVVAHIWRTHRAPSDVWRPKIGGWRRWAKRRLVGLYVSHGETYSQYWERQNLSLHQFGWRRLVREANPLPAPSRISVAKGFLSLQVPAGAAWITNPSAFSGVVLNAAGVPLVGWESWHYGPELCVVPTTYGKKKPPRPHPRRVQPITEATIAANTAAALFGGRQ